MKKTAETHNIKEAQFDSEGKKILEYVPNSTVRITIKGKEVYRWETDEDGKVCYK